MKICKKKVFCSIFGDGDWIGHGKQPRKLEARPRHVRAMWLAFADLRLCRLIPSECETGYYWRIVTGMQNQTISPTSVKNFVYASELGCRKNFEVKVDKYI